MLRKPVSYQQRNNGKRGYERDQRLCIFLRIDNGVEEWTPFDTEGWVRRLLTAKSVKITVSAKRNVGDPGNDLVASLAWVNGRDAEKDIAWTFPDGTEVNFLGAVINVTNVGAGDSTAVAPLEFEIQSNGKPEVIPASE